MRIALILALALCGAVLVAPVAAAGTCDLCHTIFYPCQPFCDSAAGLVQDVLSGGTPCRPSC